MQKHTNVLYLKDIRKEMANARYVWRWSLCNHIRLSERTGISLKVAQRWVTMFRRR